MRIAEIFISWERQPEGPDGELGYILPAGPVQRNGAAEVVGFTEKPEPSYARDLIRLGALWNLFILVGGIGALLESFSKIPILARAPQWVRRSIDRLRATPMR